MRGTKTLWAPVFTFLIFSMVIIGVGSSPETAMVVEPENSSGTVDSIFTIDLMVYDIVDCVAWQTNMTWNPSVLNLTSHWDEGAAVWIPHITYGDFLTGQPEGTTKAVKADYGKGWLMFGEYTLGDYPGVDGDGWLATIEFKVVGTGDTVLDIASHYDPEDPMSQTYFLDRWLAEIPMTPLNGYFVDVPTPMATDLNEDGFIDVRDLAMVAKKWGWTGTPGEIPEDIDDDGDVDISDLAAVALDYGTHYYP